MKDINSVIVSGRLTHEPELKYTAANVSICKFSIACNDSFISNNEQKQYTSYLDVIVWGKQGENCNKYLNKGSNVGIVGSLKQNRWQDQQSGKNRSKIEITAQSVHFLSNNNNSQNNQNNDSQYANETAQNNVNNINNTFNNGNDQSIPF